MRSRTCPELCRKVGVIEFGLNRAVTHLDDISRMLAGLQRELRPMQRTCFGLSTQNLFPYALCENRCAVYKSRNGIHGVS